MEWEYFIDESEEFIAKFEYESVTGKVKVLAATDKRAFAFKKSHNDYKFVSSHKTISQIEYGVFRMPYYIWIYVFVSFFLQLSNLFTNLSPLNIILFLSPCTVLIICIVYRKFEYINTAVGCEPFRVLSLKESIIPKIEKFINIIHYEPTGLRHSPEEYVDSNHYNRLINRLFSLMVFLISPIPLYLEPFVSAL